MITSENITFRNHVVDDTVPEDKRKKIEVIDISYPGGTVGTFPATNVDTESGKRYCDLYAVKYAAFKNGDPDADRVAILEREIAERQAELDSLRKPINQSVGQGAPTLGPSLDLAREPA